MGDLQPAEIKIDANNITVRNRLGETQGDRPGVTTAVEDEAAP